MVDTALLWIGAVLAVGIGAAAVAVRRDAAGERSPTPFVAVAAAVGYAAELAGANGYLGSLPANLLSAAGFLTAGALLGRNLLRRWRAWGEERADASL